MRKLCSELIFRLCLLFWHFQSGGYRRKTGVPKTIRKDFVSVSELNCSPVIIVIVRNMPSLSKYTDPIDTVTVTVIS